MVAVVAHLESGITVNEGRSRIYRRKDGKYLIYLDYSLGTDSMFPFPLEKGSDIHVKVFFNKQKRLIIEKWSEEANTP